MLNRKITIIGIGYVGLPAALLLAKAGHTVIGYDVNKTVVNSVNDGTVFVEEDMRALLIDDTVKKNFRASSLIESSDIFIIAVPTPLHKRKKSSDLTMVTDALNKIAVKLKKNDLVIIESTIPPLTCKEVALPILEQTGLVVGADIFLAHCPERLLPGDVLKEIVSNTRIIGGVDMNSAIMAKEIYESFVKGEIVITDSVTAELAKLMENTYRDVNIALANEFFDVATAIGINPFEAIQLANLHPRVDIMKPGIGVGGHCLPIDPWFINEVSPFDCEMIITARRINDRRPSVIAKKIRKFVAQMDNPSILILGTSYKQETNDKRESPALKIKDLLMEDGYSVDGYDPLSGVDDVKLLYKLVSAADCIVILVEHKKLMDQLNEIIETMKKNKIDIPLVCRFSTLVS